MKSEPIRPRTVAEEHLYMECTPCTCGERRPPDGHELLMRGGDMISIHAGPCPACGRERRFEFVAPVQAAIRDAVCFGGAAPSTVLDPGQLLAASDRLATGVDSRTAAAMPADARADAWYAMRRAAYAVEEVLKFIPEGQDEVAAGAFHSAEGAELRLARASQFRRDRLDARLRSYRVAAARLKPPGAKRDMASDYKPGFYIDWMNRETLDAHGAWLRRGRTGVGRLVLERCRLDKAPADRKKLMGARFEACKMSQILLQTTDLSDAELIDCLLDDGELSAANLDGALLRNCVLRTANLSLAWLQRTRIHGGDWTQVQLDRALMHATEAEDVSFVGGLFGDASLDRSVFTGCDFRNASFSRQTPGMPKLCGFIDTAFIDCDFRGAKMTGRRLSGTLFERCRFAGVEGKPVVEGPYEVTGADIDVETLWGNAR